MLLFSICLVASRRLCSGCQRNLHPPRRARCRSHSERSVRLLACHERAPTNNCVSGKKRSGSGLSAVASWFSTLVHSGKLLSPAVVTLSEGRCETRVDQQPGRERVLSARCSVAVQSSVKAND